MSHLVISYKYIFFVQVQRSSSLLHLADLIAFVNPNGPQLFSVPLAEFGWRHIDLEHHRTTA